jgi:hypothetical protein
MLKLFTHIEEDVRRRQRALPRTGRVSVSQMPVDAACHLEGQGRAIQIFRLVAEVRITSDDTADDRADARRTAAELLAHELFGDLRDELEATLRWAYRTGAGRDVEKQICRLLTLVQGRDAPEIEDADR